MAEKTVAKLESELAAMLAQRDELAAKVAKLEAAIDRDIDVRDVAGEVDRLSIAGADLETKRRVLAGLESQHIPALTTSLKEAQDGERQAAISKLRKVELRQWKAAAAIVFGELDERLCDLAKTHSELRHLGAYPHEGYTCVFEGVRQAKRQRARDTGDYAGMPWDWPKD